MKKIFGLFILCMTFALTSCEQPEAPASLVGRWRVLGDHWTATFEEDGELYISSTKYDCFYPYQYTATSDSLYICDFRYTTDAPAEDDNEYVCAYSFKGNPTLVIENFGAIFENIGTVADKIKKKESVVLTRSTVYL